jgi:hypothetical protein
MLAQVELPKCGLIFDVYHHVESPSQLKIFQVG